MGKKLDFGSFPCVAEVLELAVMISLYLFAHSLVVSSLSINVDGLPRILQSILF